MRKITFSALLICILLLLSSCGNGILEEQKYQSVYDDLVSKMLASSIIAEELCNDTVSVWHNSIYKINSADTDLYTLNNKGAFFEDFNDALDSFSSSDEYKRKVYEIQKNNNYINELLHVIKNPPEKYKGNMLDAFVDFYSSYQSFIQLTLNFNESYNSFTEKFGKIDESVIEAYRKAAFYMSGN